MTTPALTFTVAALPEHIDELGHVNHKVYLAWAEEAGVRHWRLRAPALMQAAYFWVASRIEVDFRGESKLGETLTVETWLGERRGARYDRHVRIVGSDGRVRAEAVTTWALIDAATRRPTRVNDDIVGSFA
ncbi:MAG: acyl-CoA thioesterase [Caulobacterales bacterium]|jgi:acyl-CoA thioester hydrolase